MGNDYNMYVICSLGCVQNDKGIEIHKSLQGALDHIGWQVSTVCWNPASMSTKVIYKDQKVAAQTLLPMRKARLFMGSRR